MDLFGLGAKDSYGQYLLELELKQTLPSYEEFPRLLFSESYNYYKEVTNYTYSHIGIIHSRL